MKDEYASAKQRTRDYLEKAGIEHHMSYGPVAIDYWATKLRVLAVNMEPYGYEDCGHVEVDLKCLLDWMYDRGSTRTRTVRYTLAIVRTLLDGYNDGVVPCAEYLRSSYADALTLETVARKVAYYNIRSTSNSKKNQDAARIVGSGSDGLSDYIRDEMIGLSPKIILISGRAGLASFNAMWHLEPPLRFLNRFRHPNGFFIQSVSHPSRPNYRRFTLVISELLRALNAKSDSAI